MSVTEIFLLIWKMSLTGGVAVLLIWPVSKLLYRLKTPATLRYLLWFVVLFRLLCPYSFSADLSLFQWTPLERGLQTAQQLPQQIPTGSPATSRILEPGLIQEQGSPLTPTVAAPTTPAPRGEGGDVATAPAASSNQSGPAVPYTPAVQRGWQPLRLLSGIWLAGATGLLLYSLLRYLRFRRSLATAVRLDGDIYTCEQQPLPFVCGFWRPRIYLPLGLDTAEAAYIIQHERAHLRRMDHWWKLIWFLACCLHWFNPLAWLAFYEMGKAMEMSCDEAVLREFGPGIKTGYSLTLLAAAAPCHWLAGNPLTFGEFKTKERVQNVLRYQKPLLGALLAAAAVVLTVALVLVANPTVLTPYEAPLLRYPDVVSASILRPEEGYYPTRIVVKDAESLDHLGELLLSGEQLRAVPGDLPPVEDALTVFFVTPTSDYTYYAYELDERFYVEQPGLVAYEIDQATFDKLYAGFRQTDQARISNDSIYLVHTIQHRETLANGETYRYREWVRSHLMTDEDRLDIFQNILNQLAQAYPEESGIPLTEIDAYFAFRRTALTSHEGKRQYISEKFYIYQEQGQAYLQLSQPEMAQAMMIPGYTSRRMPLSAEQYQYFAGLFQAEDYWRPAAARANTSFGGALSDLAELILTDSTTAAGAQSYGWLSSGPDEPRTSSNELLRTDAYLLLQERLTYAEAEGHYQEAYAGNLYTQPYLYDVLEGEDATCGFFVVGCLPYRLIDGTLLVGEAESLILILTRAPLPDGGFYWNYQQPRSAAAITSTPLVSVGAAFARELIDYRNNNPAQEQLEAEKWTLLAQMLQDYPLRELRPAELSSYNSDNLYYYI